MITEPDIKNIMLESTKEIFETMIFLPLEESDKDFEDSDKSKSVISSITFGGQWEGCLLVHCSMESAQRIAKAMLMMAPTESVEEAAVCDALGEVMNMIIGGMKTRLLDTIGEMQISIPSTSTGQPLAPMLRKAAERVDLLTNIEDETLKFILQYSDKSRREDKFKHLRQKQAESQSKPAEQDH